MSKAAITALVLSMIFVAVAGVAVMMNRRGGMEVGSGTTENLETSNEQEFVQMPETTTPMGLPAATGAVMNAVVGLTISSPVSGQAVTNPSIQVRGKTKAGAEVTVNEVEIVADSQGNFSTYLTLDEGENTIVVVANDSEGNWIEKEVIVTLNSE